MSNLFKAKEEKIFYCWVDHDFFMADNNYKKGSFFSSDFAAEKSGIKTDDYLMFLPNPNHNNFISPFQYRLLNSYLAEYNLELSRKQYFKEYPGRLSAIFLFESETEANKYKERNFDHVGNRCLRKARSVFEYKYSIHDCSWIEFLRLSGNLDNKTIHNVCDSYWKGIRVEQCELMHADNKWTEEPIYEVLYSGRVDFIK